MSAALDWVLQCLCAGDGGVRVSTGATPPPGGRAVESFAVLPSAARPRLLLPLGSRRVASMALRQHRASRRLIRLATPPLALALRAGAAGVLLRERVQISLEDPAVQPGDILLTEHLREVFGGRDLYVAVLFDAPRPHRKPTLHILDADGTALGFAKIGWNHLTRSLVRAEARALEELSRRPPPRTFTPPRLLHAERWGELEILIVEPISVDPPHRGRRLLREAPAAATSEVARLEGTTRAGFGESAYWAHLRARVADTEAQLGSAARRDLRAAAEQLAQRHGHTELDFGFWHGDWVPWNMGHQRGRLHVWDWERSGRPAPVGLDAVHFEFQVELGLRGAAPWPGVQRTLGCSPQRLAAVGVPGRLGRLLLSLHLLEMALRFDEARAAGVDTTDPKYLGVLLRMLDGPASCDPSRRNQRKNRLRRSVGTGA